jgi:UDP-glucose 4-epimerase
MRILITGGAGFIGSALARVYVAQGADVTVVDSLLNGRRESVPDGVRLRVCDIRDPALEDVFREHGPFDVVSHHAALKDVRKALIDPSTDADVNIVGTLNVLRCAAEHQTGRFMFPSSAAVYGDPDVFPTSEAEPVAPISPYGIAKAAGEAYCRFFALNRGLPVVALRYSTVYGPAAAEEGEAGVITIFAKRMLSGRRPIIFGDGEQTRDLVHIDDVVHANLLAAERAPRPWAVYNVATGVETSVRHMFHLVASGAEFGEEPVWEAPKAGEVRRNVLDAARIRSELGWAPQHELEEGLRRVVEAYRAEVGEPVLAAR